MRASVRVGRCRDRQGEHREVGMSMSVAHLDAICQPTDALIPGVAFPMFTWLLSQAK